MILAYARRVLDRALGPEPAHGPDAPVPYSSMPPARDVSPRGRWVCGQLDGCLDDGTGTCAYCGQEMA